MSKIKDYLRLKKKIKETEVILNKNGKLNTCFFILSNHI